MSEELKYEDLNLQHYKNSRIAFANLTPADLAKAAVLAPLNLLLIGDTGTGKTQLAEGVYNGYFKGNKREGGNGVLIRAHPEIDIYNEIFTELNIEKARRDLTDNVDSLVYMVDEINRAPPVAQNQFFGLGDGAMDYKGKSIKLGKEGYHVLIATANLGNGEFQGTFNTDKALYNRLNIALDFDTPELKPTEKDRIELDKLVADPRVKTSEKRDISQKVISASQEIAKISSNLGLEERAAVNYLRFGLDNCQKYGKKDKSWPRACQDCEYNHEENSLCSLTREPSGERVISTTKRYAAALYFLAKLKDPKIEIDPVDLIFKSFELAGTYQFLLNPQTLKQQYFDQNPKMMANVMEQLKKDFRENEDYILASMGAAEKGKKITVFFKDDKDNLGNYDKLKNNVKEKIEKLSPYTDEREVGMSWMNKAIDCELEEKRDKSQ